MQSGKARLVGVNFARGPKKQFVLTEVQDFGADCLFASSVENKTDAGPIMRMFGQD